MDRQINALLKIIPKELDILKRRYKILGALKFLQPIGRRALSDKLHISEKLVRTETEFLKKEGFIYVTAGGMMVEAKGLNLLEDLKEFMEQLEGISTIEAKIREVLECDEVVIVPGNADMDEETVLNMGYGAANVLLKKIHNKDIIALTGGSTVHRVIGELAEQKSGFDQVRIVPARGSLGTNVAYQANTLVAMLAQKLHCSYSLLNIPDNLSQRALESVREEPEIQSTIESLLKANVLLYGIGNARKMANRRNLNEELTNLLIEKEAVAEALGNYYDKKGNIIYTSRSIGVTIDQMKDLRNAIAVAGGASKAEAILAVRDILRGGCIIMDEGAANGVLTTLDQLG